MIKFFLTLYFTFVGAIIFTVLAVLLIMSDIIDSVETPELSERTFTGTGHLLNQSIEGLEKDALEKKVTELKQHFPPLFDLLDQSDIEMSKQQRQDLEKNKLISIVTKDIKKLELAGIADDEEELTLHYFKRPHSSQVWQMNTDFNIDINAAGQITVSGGKMLRGMFYMAEQGFLNIPQSQWLQHLKVLQASHQFPLRLKSLKALNVSEEVLNKLKKGEALNITQNQRFVTFAHRIANSQKVLVFEVAEIPWSLYNMLFIVILSVVSFLALPILLWVWPLWRHLEQLKLATDKFGKGEYTARVPHAKYSRLASISNAFNAMAERTQRSIDSHKELTSAVSHELRTPVARMRFSLEMLHNNDDKEDQKRHIDDINTDIEELDLLLGELLTYARFDRNSDDMKLQSHVINDWFDSSMQRLLPLANQLTLDYQLKGIDGAEEAIFDPRLMSRVLDNLVQNALRYANSRVKVRLGKDHQYFVLSVDDDGIGIAEEDKHKLFDAFSRIDSSRDRRSGGFGLGLAIVKRIVEGHKGSIRVEDSKLGGARFVVRW